VNPFSTPKVGRLFRWSLLTVCVFLWLFLHWSIPKKWPGVFTGQGLDTDCYTRLIRVQHLIDSGNWFDNRIPQYNAPFGGNLHWSRPFDVLLLAGTLLFKPFFPQHEALYWAGVFVSPLLHILCCMAIFWATKPLMKERERLLTVLIFILQLGIISYSSLGRADHHSLIFLIYVLSLGFLFRLTDASTPFNRAGLGLTFAMGMWVSVEGQVPVFFGMAFLALGWWLGFVRAGKTLVPVCWWYLSGITLSILVERPPFEWLTVENDKVSFIHFSEAFLLLAFWRGLAFLEGNNPPRGGFRLCGIFIGLILCGIILLSAFPHIYQIPVPGMDAKMRILWSGILENRPLWPPDAEKVSLALSMIGHFFFACPVLAVFLIVLRNFGENRLSWTGILCWATISSLLTVTQLRFMYLPEVVLAMITAKVIGHIMDLLERLKNLPLKAFLGFFLPVFLIIGPAIAGQLVRSTDSQPDLAMALKSMISALNDKNIIGSGPSTILAWANYGPEIAYKTLHKVVAEPYHRDQEGLSDVLSILGGEDDARIRKVLEHRRADFILIFPHDPSFIMPGIAKPPAQCLHERLSRNEVPSWLQSLPFESLATTSFKLFRILP